MLRQRECRPFSRKDRVHFLKRDRSGVASTVGTIMALLVFLTFLALFTNSYIPVWMLTNERNHMNTVFNEFGDMKGKLDNMVVMASTTGSNALNMYAPITLGADGIPIFAAPTAGILSYIPYSQQNSTVEVKFKYNLDAVHMGLYVDSIGGGAVQLYASNRYYVEQWICYENGAILVKQYDGQLVRAIPSLEATKVGNYVNVTFTQFDFIGKNTTVAGTGVTGINIDLIYLDQQTYSNYTASGPRLPLKFTITMQTMYASAWTSYLTQAFKANGLTASDYTLTTVRPGVIKITFNTVWSFGYNVATFNMGVQNA